jgi:hypothetical protein
MTNRAPIRMIVLGTLALTIGALALYVSTRAPRLENAFQSASPGMTSSDITIAVGTPWRTAKCGATFGGTEPQACDHELLYAHPFAPIVPTYWAFRYDHNGKLIDKYQYVSP